MNFAVNFELAGLDVHQIFLVLTEVLSSGLRPPSLGQVETSDGRQCFNSHYIKFISKFLRMHTIGNTLNTPLP